MNPAISILVPICNVEKFLNKCLQSIVEQTLENIEIICINDGSKDNSLNIIQSFAEKDNRIKIIDKSNTGYGDSMNCGLKMAQGEYIGIVESDDFVDSRIFEVLYEYAQKYDSDIVKSSFYFYWENPQKIIYNNSFNINKISLNFKENNNSLLHSIPSIWAAIYKRKWLIENKIHFLNTPGAAYQDTSFHFKTACLAKNIILMPEAYLYYRQDNALSSVKNAAMEKVLALHKELEEIRSFVNTLDDKNVLKIYYPMAIEKYMWNYGRIEANQKDKYFKILVSEINKSLAEWNEYLTIDNGIVKYLEFLSIKYNSKFMLDFLFLLKKIKRKCFNN